MSTEKHTKINQLLQLQPIGVVLLSSWLEKRGYNLDLQKRYKRSNWLKSIGTGAMIRNGDNVGYEGALYALQQQQGLSIHLGGRSALSAFGKAHYLELAQKRVVLFGQPKEVLPTWFRKRDWGVTIDYHQSSFLPQDLGITETILKNLSVKLSSPARALMECLYLTPTHQDLLECCELMEGMNNLRPVLVQELLEQCKSVKVKRLFLYLADKYKHEWLMHLNLKTVDLGSGKRSLVKDGIYIPKYQITVPEKVAAHGRVV